MSIKVPEHRFPIGGNKVYHDFGKVEEVYTASEIDKAVSELQNTITSVKSELQLKLNEVDTKVINSLEQINKQLGNLPTLMKTDLEFKEGIKKEILEEVMLVLESRLVQPQIT
jgi:hypothetical protein